MGPYSVASQLQAEGLEVVVLDYFTKKSDFFEYLSNFIGDETVAVGISSTFLSPHRRGVRGDNFIVAEQAQYFSETLFCEDDFQLKKWFSKLKELLSAKAPKGRIFLGGTKAPSAISNAAVFADVDYVCVGAGDYSFRDAVVALSKGEEPDHFVKSGVRILSGLSTKVRTQLCPEAHMNSNFGIQMNEALPIEISRGCVFNCKFCHYEKKESIRKDPVILKNEMIRNYERFGTTTYYFTDDCFNDHRQKVDTYCEMFLSLPFKIEWVAYARVDVAVKFPETARLMVESGARGLFWGLESFNEEVARKAGKGTPTDKVKSFLLDFYKDYRGRCMSAGSFIVGLPGEDEASIRSTMSWLAENDALDMIYVGPLMIAPYAANLDKLVIDYADYSRNPEKHGFKTIRFSPDYWEHEQMNSDQANVLSKEFYRSWSEIKKVGPVVSVWRYPHLRTLGFTPDEIFGQLKLNDDSERFGEMAESRFEHFLEDYFQSLIAGTKSCRT
ncbi:hypothetical protein BH10BDE1_BH10BDE1_02940 [soil metagenome]